MTLDTIPLTPVGEHLLDRLVRAGFATTRPPTDLSEARLYEYATRAAADVSAQKWSADPKRWWPWEAAVSREDAQRLAGAVATSTAARWWSDPMTTRPQVWIAHGHAEPVATLSSPTTGGKPPTRIWTSSAVAGLPCAWWALLKDGADSPPPHGPQSVWQLSPRPDATVFEIRTTADWQWLCERFPGPDVDGWVAPDWEAAGEELDGIHLTVEGLVRAQGVEIETRRGAAKLENWDSESTAWLRWSMIAAKHLGVVMGSGAPPPPTRGRAFPRVLRRS